MKFISTALILLSIVFFSQGQNSVTTYAGSTSGYADGDTATCKFKAPFGMCIDHSGNIYIADNSDHRIRKISADGIVTTIGGTGTAGYLDGPASTSKFNAPSDLCVDDSGNVYVSDFQNQYIRKISASGIVSTIAGNGIAGYKDGPADSAEFNYPRGICRDGQGNLFIADSWNHRIRKIDINGNVTTFAGHSDTIGVQSPGDYADGSDTSARFNVPCGMSIDTAGNLYLADAYNHRIRKISPQAEVTTIAGSGSIGPGAGGFLNGDIAVARLNTPTEVFVNAQGAVYIGDTYNNRIRMVVSNTVSTVAGNGTSGFVNGIDSLAEFKSPRGIVADAPGTHLFVCDNGNHVIRKISPAIGTGILAIAQEEAPSLFPNPADNSVFISLPKAATKVSVYDLQGREIIALFPTVDSLLEINALQLPAGFYFISALLNNSERCTAKLLIQH